MFIFVLRKYLRTTLAAMSLWDGIVPYRVLPAIEGSCTSSFGYLQSFVERPSDTRKLGRVACRLHIFDPLPPKHPLLPPSFHLALLGHDSLAGGYKSWL